MLEYRARDPGKLPTNFSEEPKNFAVHPILAYLVNLIPGQFNLAVISFALKGLRNIAQGCRAAATLGKRFPLDTTPTGLRHKTSKTSPPCHNRYRPCMSIRYSR